MSNRDYGSKPGSGGVLGSDQLAIINRKRLEELALSKVDLTKDPYFMRNHLGSFECKLCLTLHNNEGNYLAHTQGKKHQTNLRRRVARDAKLRALNTEGAAPPNPLELKKRLLITQTTSVIKIGRPGFKVTKQFDPETSQRGLLFQIHYPQVARNTQPRHRIISSFSQSIEQPNKNYQYILFAAEPYETIGFKIPNKQIERDVEKFGEKIFVDWDRQKKVFSVQLQFKNEQNTESKAKKEQTEDSFSNPQAPTAK